MLALRWPTLEPERGDAALVLLFFSVLLILVDKKIAAGEHEYSRPCLTSVEALR
jgi:hypothetical protein